MKLVFATLSLLLAEGCYAKTARLRNTNMAYKGSSGRELQVENIFDQDMDKTAIAEPVLISVDPTEVPVETIDVTISMSMPDIPEPVLIAETPVDPVPELISATPELIAVDPTDAPIETIDVFISMSMPETEEAEVLPATLPATTAAPETTAAVDEEMSMSMPEPVLPTVVGTTTTAAATTTTETVDEEVDVLPATLPATTAAPETTAAPLDMMLSMPMSMPEEFVPYSDDEMASMSMSMPTSTEEDTTETYGEYKPPVEERLTLTFSFFHYAVILLQKGKAAGYFFHLQFKYK
eukprot:scaffold29791_cov70-Cyclotella_meneghiniana.AAC.2